MTLPEPYLRYMNNPITRGIRGTGSIQAMDNDQLVAILANKPNVMTAQAWANAGGSNWDPTGALYVKYLSLRSERGLPTTAVEANPARAAALSEQGHDPDTVEKMLMRQNPMPQPFNARAAMFKDMGTTPEAFDKMTADARALPVVCPYDFHHQLDRFCEHEGSCERVRIGSHGRYHWLDPCGLAFYLHLRELGKGQRGQPQRVCQLARNSPRKPFGRTSSDGCDTLDVYRRRDRFDHLGSLLLVATPHSA